MYSSNILIIKKLNYRLRIPRILIIYETKSKTIRNI